MWKKPESDDIEAESSDKNDKPAKVQGAIPARKEAATIGPSISIRGDLTGEEDVIVQGRVEGTIDLKQNNLTVGREGRVNASVRANIISVDGQVEGDLSGDEQVIIRRSGNVQGNIVAPRVTLEDGCQFKGSIDMDVPEKGARTVTSAKRVADVKPIVSSAGNLAQKTPGSAAEEKVSSP